MAFAEVASRRATAEAGAFSSTTLAYPANITSGDLLIAAGGYWDTSTGYTVTLSDTRSTSWTVFKSTELAGGGGFYSNFIGFGVASSSGACTVTLSATGDSGSNYASFSIDEFSGQDATPLDVDGGSTLSGGASTTASDSLTTLTANDLIIGVMLHNSGGGSPSLTPNGSYTQIGEIESNANCPHNAVFRIVTTAQAYTVDWTLGSAVFNIAQTVAFKEATGGGGTPTTHLLCLTGVGN